MTSWRGLARLGGSRWRRRAGGGRGPSRSGRWGCGMPWRRRWRGASGRCGWWRRPWGQCRSPSNSPDAFFNINTPGDLAEAERMLKERGVRVDTVVMVDWSGGNDTGRRPREGRDLGGGGAGGGAGHSAGLPAQPRDRGGVAARSSGGGAARGAAGARRVRLSVRLSGRVRGAADGAGRSAGRLGRGWPTIWRMGRRGTTASILRGGSTRCFPGVGPFWFNATGAGDRPSARTRAARGTGTGWRSGGRSSMRAKGSFTCWQMGGAGAVGSQVMTGMAALERLRRAFPGEVAVWPFEALEPAGGLRGGLAVAPRRRGEGGDAAGRREGCGAGPRAGPRRGGGGAGRAAWPGCSTPCRRGRGQEEGWILGVGAEEALAFR